MMQFHLTSELAKPLAQHINRAPSVDDPYLADFYWKADITMLAGEPCIIAQEQNTLYVMIFCGLDSQDFQLFPELFRKRFAQELTAICKTANLFEPLELAKEIAELCEQQHYKMDPDPIDEGKIPNVIEKLQRRLLEDKLPLPVDARDAFEYTLPINSRKPKTADPNMPTPAEQIGNLCLNLIERKIAQQQAEQELEQQQRVEQAIISEQDNIVHVNFGQRS